MNANNNVNPWLDGTLYPFESKFVQLEAGSMHYVDEGEGDLILFIHGTPTWSFLYRDFVKQLSRSYRCIAIDHIGFGLSEKPESFSGSPQHHSKNLIEFIHKLNLNNITLVAHDFGGPIGLGAAIECSERVSKIAIFNTWLWATKDDPMAMKIDKIVNSAMGRFFYLNLNFSPKYLLKKGFSDKKYLSKNKHKHYIKPFPNKTSRMSLLNIGKSLVGSSDWYQTQWQKLDKLAGKEWLILWGMQDHFVTTKYLDKWKERLPQAKIREMDCGHFVQEEKPNEAILEINSFMKNHKSQHSLAV